MRLLILQFTQLFETKFQSIASGINIVLISTSQDDEWLLFFSGGYAKYVRVGDLDIVSTSDDARPQEVTVAENIKHPEYKPPSKYNDIALLRLETKINLNPYARPACLNTKATLTNKKAITTGWGRTDYSGESSSHLLKVTLDMYANSQCNNSYEIDRKLKNGIVETQICAGSKNDTKDACQGDSGGPIQIFNKNVFCMYDVIGVTSFGKACGIANVPGVYTNVYSYLGWIESVVWPTL